MKKSKTYKIVKQSLTGQQKEAVLNGILSYQYAWMRLFEFERKESEDCLGSPSVVFVIEEE